MGFLERIIPKRKEEPLGIRVRACQSLAKEVRSGLETQEVHWVKEGEEGYRLEVYLPYQLKTGVDLKILLLAVEDNVGSRCLLRYYSLNRGAIEKGLAELRDDLTKTQPSVEFPQGLRQAAEPEYRQPSSWVRVKPTGGEWLSQNPFK